MDLGQYISNLNSRYKLGNATEHTFRGDLQQLLETIVSTIRATNEPKRQACGAPDFILTHNDIPVGYIETKDIGDKDLAGEKPLGNKKQFDRYKQSLPNLIFTDYLRFRLYHEGKFINEVEIGKVIGKSIKPLTENFSTFENLLKDFCMHVGPTITSSKKLAGMMAAKARLLSNVIENALNSDEEKQENSELKRQVAAFREVLIHDIKHKDFADVYAQTIAYGLFAARLHDPTPASFTRQEAAEHIPKSNPFLRKLFNHIAGPDIDDRIRWIVDSLAKVFLACDVDQILKSYGKQTQTEDPIIHFYETFLSEYDPALRKQRGVWYTPKPVVNFIVRGVDEILKTEFGLPEGLADYSKTKIRVNIKNKEGEQDIHRVQILDPATGTGAFLAEVIKHIYTSFEGQQGIWGDYVENHLLPRLNGFEILMASYAMAHLQLDLLLREKGYVSKSHPRFQVYLTNSLEESHPDTETIFASWLSAEANEANHIKSDIPVMCVIGNPPYSGESANKGKWIMDLMEDYKKEPGGTQKLKERNPKWINDDYVKFIRYGQYFIERNGSGILAFINPHGFLDNPTFRGMRWNLLKAYDKIYTIDLHGNNNKKETSDDGSADENVFDIQQGVSINFFIKTGRKKSNELAKVLHYDLRGKREQKYSFLRDQSISSINYATVKVDSPHYFMIPKGYDLKINYQCGISVHDLFLINSPGIVTSKDAVLVDKDVEILIRKIESAYDIQAQKMLIKKLSYRPFDNQFVYFDVDIIERARKRIMHHLLSGANIGLVVVKRQPQDTPVSYVFLSEDIISNGYIRSDSVSIDSIFPLYKYPENSDQQTLGENVIRTPNLNMSIVNQIANELQLIFTPEKEDRQDTFSPIDLLDYIYAVLHCPSYREKYQDFLKTDFPRVPYPTNTDIFWQLVQLGSELRQLHLLKSISVMKPITQYPINGDNVVTKPVFEAGRVFINNNQYFANVPEIAWHFYIGGYQPAQKWLKDRKEEKLSTDDIRHYQKIIVALTETHRIMGEIDQILIEA